MFEFDKYDPGKPGLRTRPQRDYKPFAGVKNRALLLWGEHCIECAAPECFATCDLYEARPDERCRRFVYGVYRNTGYPSAQGFGAEVVFRRWGKLEARGNATMVPTRLCSALERGVLAGLPLFSVVGRFARRLGAEIRWSYLAFGAMERLNRWLLKRRDPRHSPDAFVAEIYNPGPSPLDLLFSIAVDRTQIPRKVAADQVPRPFARRLTIEPGYNRFDIAATEFIAIVDSGLPFNLALTPGAEDGAHLVFLRLDLVVYDREAGAHEGVAAGELRAPASRPPAKMVVFDLDNTLWNGILLEGSVKLRPNIPALFAELDARGILISLVSKNSHADAMRRLKDFDLDRYLLFPQVNWNQKSKSLAIIAEKVSINLDTFIFVDDSPFEREEVSRAYPVVEVLPDTSIKNLLDHPRLKGSKTAEARQRRAMYQAAINREDAALSFGDDYMAFLKSCDIVVEIMPFAEPHLDRVLELVQRTNQLNFSGRKYSREKITSILEDKIFNKHVLAASDKFGTYGVVGFALTIFIFEGVRVEDFMLSCRVQGKFIEQAFFNYLVRSTTPPARVLEINFVKTERNGLAEAVLRTMGFPVDDRAGRGDLRKVLEPADFAVDFLTLHTVPLTDREAAL